MSLELPIIPKSGEVFLAINLSAVENLTVAETLNLLEQMGYRPQLRYRQAKDGKVSLYALLKHDRVEPEMLTNIDYLGDELDALAEVIQPADAITSPRGLSPAKKAVTA
ncbi:acyl carrier protein [Scytonema sp. NUACC26]|uniref:acyl carrier protein n=1 Tax=Scytonema sp. NUACC26 TaxID=3140176 RepID=UPI0034DC3934